MARWSTMRGSVVALVAVTALVVAVPQPASGDRTRAPRAVLVGAGDIAACPPTGATATAALVASIPGTVFTLGDNVQGVGTPSEYAGCYEPTWGAFRSRTRPAPGNHDYRQPGAGPYFDYFGAAAGPRGAGYYSYDAGSWHVVVLNSNCDAVGCDAGSAQNAWLRADLALNASRCTLAYMHHPRFSVGFFGNNTSVTPLWQTLYAAGAELVLSGHDHNYQRFRPMRPNGTRDLAAGIVQIVAGTGGYAHGAANRTDSNLVAKNTTTFGVVRLTLEAGGASVRYLSTDGSYSDTTWIACH